jgi:hypothetical protein
MSGPRIDLSLPDPERHLAAALGSRWVDLLYAPGAGFTSALDPGVYRSTFVIVLHDGPAVRVSSLVTPAFGGEVCRLRLEPLARYRAETLGSFFEPARHGTVYALAPDRSTGAARPPDRAEWRYQGASLADRLGRVSRVRVLRERVRGPAFSWEADRGVVLTGADGGESLLLSVPEAGETALFLAAPGLYRLLLDPRAAAPPGVTVPSLLGHADRDDALEVTVELHPG